MFGEHDHFFMEWGVQYNLFCGKQGTKVFASRTTEDGSACICMHFPSSLGWPHRRRGNSAAASWTFPPVPYPASAGLDLQSKKIREFSDHRTPRASRTDLASASAKIRPHSMLRLLILCHTIRACFIPSHALVLPWEFPFFFAPFFFLFFQPLFWVSWRPHRLIVAIPVRPVCGVRRAFPNLHPVTAAQGAAQPAHRFFDAFINPAGHVVLSVDRFRLHLRAWESPLS